MTMQADVSLQDVLSRISQEVPVKCHHLDHGNRGGMIILASPLMPEFGLLIAAESGYDHRWKLAFDTTDEEAQSTWFLFKCMCCRPEIPSEERCEAMQDEKRSRTYAARFRRDLEDLCKEHGITTIFVRNAHAWDNKPYGALDGIELVEASEMRQVMEDKYSAETVDKALPVSWKYSKLSHDDYR